ncbi:MAG: hypothetical protein L0Z50_21145 [Verrucomicrobiales bacterium]|nr:hypothetical protein [Verrucomicrobiales bacterium]
MENCRRQILFDPICTCSSVHTDYFQLLNDTIRQLGYRVVSISALDEFEYRKASRNKGFRKLKLRLVMYLVFPLKLLVAAVGASRNSLFLITSNTFYAPLMVALVGQLRGFRTIQLVYDLFPDAVEVAGGIQTRGLVSRLLGASTRFTRSLCDACVYLGEFLRAHAETRWGACRISRAIHIGANMELFENPPNDNNEKPLVVHYGGQLGYMHDAETLVKCLQCFLGRSDEVMERIRFSFLISGARSQMFREAMATLPIDIGDALPSREWRKRIGEFQIGLVTLSPGGATVCLPSKTYAMMAGGLAILAICPLWSDLAKVVLDNDAGWVVNNSAFRTVERIAGEEYARQVRKPRAEEEVIEEFCNILRLVANRPDLLELKRANARKAAREAYDQGSLSRDWAELISAVKDRGNKSRL